MPLAWVSIHALQTAGCDNLSHFQAGVSSVASARNDAIIRWRQRNDVAEQVAPALNASMSQRNFMLN